MLRPALSDILETHPCGSTQSGCSKTAEDQKVSRDDEPEDAGCDAKDDHGKADDDARVGSLLEGEP